MTVTVTLISPYWLLMPFVFVFAKWLFSKSRRTK